MTNKQKQNLLAYLGYYTGEIDGVLGPQSATAIQAFQSAEGLTADGDAGEATQAALLAAVANGRFASNVSSGDFWDDIRYFRRAEFACKCGCYCNGYPAEPAEALVRTADRVRAHFDAPVTVSSGVRCPKHNAEVGGVTNSRHLTGHAMDYCVRGHTADEVLAYALAQPEIQYAYAIDANYVHMDIGK